MSSDYAPLVSVVIPCYRPNPKFLRETLASLAAQSLHRSLFEVIVVDDGSDNDEALGLVDEFRQDATLNIKFIKHEQNLWLAAARTTGAEASVGEYVVFLDDDDLLDTDYLEKTLLLLQSTPYADWVYTSHRKFGQRNEIREASEFSALSFSLRNRMSYSSMFRLKAWLEVGQRKQQVVGDINQFEDWDMYVRMMTRGMLGTPLRDTKFHYRKSTQGLAARSVRAYILSAYKLYRSSFFRFFALPLVMLKHRRHRRKGFARLSIFHPARPLNTFLGFLAKRFIGAPELPAIVTAKMATSAIFNPAAFSQRVMNDLSMLSLAALRSGFEGEVDMSFTRFRNFPSKPRNQTVLAAHIWWQMGGAENIYWYWLQSARQAGCEKVVNLVSYDDHQSSVLKHRFAEVSDTQYALSSFGETPLQRLKTAWNLIDLERPRVVFISSNSYLYQLTPHIKREFPSIQIVDILHNEYDGLIDWYSISADFDPYIDKRIVTSSYWKDLLISKYKVDPEKIVLARNPVDTALYDPNKFDRDAILAGFKINPDRKVVSFIGRLHPQKGLDVFLELAESMNTHSDFQFVIVGDGELHELVKDSVKRLNNLSYLGYFHSVERVLAMTDILICPSLYEGAPLIGLEAAAMNTALIAPNLVGFKEQINEGGFGILYDASLEVQTDVQVLRDMLLNRSEELLKKAQLGRPFVLQHHALEVVGKHYQKEFAQLMS